MYGKCNIRKLVKNLKGHTITKIYICIQSNITILKKSLVWAKVKAAASKLSGKVRDDVKAVIEKLKPQILDHLNTVKEIVIDAGKKIIIQVKDGVVRIIVDALKVESEIETYGLSDCK